MLNCLRNFFLCFLFLYSLSLLSNEKNRQTSTSCEKKDCKIYIKPKEKKPKISENQRNQTLSLTNSLKLIQKENTKLEATAQKQWKKRLEKIEIGDEENNDVLDKIYEKGVKFSSATGN
ncbi:MAG: hypothetical protein N3A69_11515 [Leptospiraceae bacterium]|nr:hypothetical protein [Leptospiraceae bacterium]